MYKGEEFEEAAKRVFEDWMINWMIESGIMKQVEADTMKQEGKKNG